METATLAVRLAGMEASLIEIKNHLATQNGRLGTVERWQAGTDPVIESISERVDQNCDELAKQRTWIDRFDGGISARTQMIIQIGSALSILGCAVKLIFFLKG